MEPCLDGFTTTGQPRRSATSSTVAGAISQSAVGTPAMRKSRFETSLSMAIALPMGTAAGVGHPDHLEHGLQRAVLTAAAVECKEQHVRVADHGQVAEPREAAARAPGPCRASAEGGAVPTLTGEELGLVVRRDEAPGGVHDGDVVAGLRRARMTCTADAMATSRSAEVPPVRTVIRM